MHTKYEPNGNPMIMHAAKRDTVTVTTAAPILGINRFIGITSIASITS